MAKLLSFQDSTQMLLPHERAGTDHRSLWPWRRWFAKDDTIPPQREQPAETPRPNLARRISRKAIPGLPRPGTFKRQQSELRDNLEPVKPKPHERRAFSVDPRRGDQLRASSRTSAPSLPHTSAPVLMGTANEACEIPNKEQETITETVEPETVGAELPEPSPPAFVEVFDDDLEEELERRWILNLSMHFRDRSKREKFFVTFAETPTHWRRVTISLDYREAPPNSLEEELQQTQYQRDKSARIYEAIRESLQDIQFYDTVTNLKLQTENERLHVHVTEDIHEVIHFPPVTAIGHLRNCRKIKEKDLVFDSHLSGFVYKVTVNGHVFIKKEIPGPDTVEEFLYEVNALYGLSGSDSVIQFGGVITDNEGIYLKGLLISFAEKGALIDVIYDGRGELSWPRRERWAKQIVQGLSEIHEAGFVQGDFTLSNIVIDAEDKAKIIDINRRGCPVGWEPPEVAALIESKQRISMYIGVKSDIFQLGMVLWAIAMQQDEPEIQPRPLTLASAPADVPSYYRALVGICLSDDPRTRCHTTSLLSMFPELEDGDGGAEYAMRAASDHGEAQYIDPANAVERDDIDNFRLLASQTAATAGPALSSGTHTYVNAPTDMSGEPYFFPTRGRSPARTAIEHHERQSQHSQGPVDAGAEAMGDSVAQESEPRVVNVSPGRHYLDGNQASTAAQDSIGEEGAGPQEAAEETIDIGEQLDEDNLNLRSTIGAESDAPEDQIANGVNIVAEAVVDISTEAIVSTEAIEGPDEAIGGIAENADDVTGDQTILPREVIQDICDMPRDVAEEGGNISKAVVEDDGDMGKMVGTGSERGKIERQDEAATPAEAGEASFSGSVVDDAGTKVGGEKKKKDEAETETEAEMATKTGSEEKKEEEAEADAGTKTLTEEKKEAEAGVKETEATLQERAVGDLAGIGGHSTLEQHGSSDDDLMTDTR